MILSIVVFYQKEGLSKTSMLSISHEWSFYLFLASQIYLPVLRFLFPPTSFAIGQGIQRYETKKFWRVTVGLSLVVGVIGSLVAVKLEWLVK
jgi:hypothetical protein